jgi:hypothetical protein
MTKRDEAFGAIGLVEGGDESNPLLFPSSPHNNPWTVHVIGSEANEVAAEIKRRWDSFEAMRKALEQMVDEKCDYMRINRLGDPEAQHTVKQARAALRLAEEGERG